MKLFKTVCIISILFLVGCRSTKSISTSGEIKRELSSKQIIKAHLKQEAKFKTLQARVKVKYIRGNSSQSHTVNMRMEKGKTIWINSFLNVIRVKITPNKVAYYNKLDNSYFEGDFSLISDLLGTELDFNKLQNLLLGESLFNLKNEPYKASIHKGSYVLQPKRQNVLLEMLLLFNPLHFKIDSQQMTQPLQERMLQIDYKLYQEVNKQIVPKTIKIFALEGDSETIINMELKSVILNRELRFPFRIPQGFKEIVIK